jgi:hypothetical protein
MARPRPTTAPAIIPPWKAKAMPAVMIAPGQPAERSDAGQQASDQSVLAPVCGTRTEDRFLHTDSLTGGARGIPCGVGKVAGGACPR